WMKTMRAMDTELRDASNDEVGFKFYPNMVMGDERDVVRKIRLGQLQGAGFTGFGLGEILPAVRLFELPYLFDSDAEVDCVKAALTADFEAMFAEKGFVLLGWVDVGWVYFFAAKPVVTPSSLRAVKPWAWDGDPLAQGFFAELGRSPVSLAITDVHLALQTGMIDAVYASPLGCLALQWFKKLAFMSDVPFTNAMGAVLVDKKTFTSLATETQVALRAIARRHLEELVRTTRQENREAYDLLQKEGLKPAPSTPAERDELRAVGLRVHDRLAGSLYSQGLLDRTRAILRDYRAKAQ
ncbi:MAG: ABC transporter substrate-binding protein, partial [Calditrichaeota bacterium]|nr:ABC transporter substrate-binding protein [Calditrichota bacterium]